MKHIPPLLLRRLVAPGAFLLAVSVLLAGIVPASAAALGPVGTAAPFADGPKDDILERALKDEMARTLEKLRMGVLEKPYFVSYTVLYSSGADVDADFGGIVNSRRFESRTLRAEVRLGDPRFDNTHFVSSSGDGMRGFTADLPLEDDYDAIRFAAWSLTDDAYKTALEMLSKKRAYKQSKLITDEVDDLDRREPQKTFVGSEVAAFDQALWEGRLRELSRVFRQYPAVQNGRVSLWKQTGSQYFIDSEGNEYRKPKKNQTIFELWAAAQAKDGMEIAHSRRRWFRSPAELPALPALKGEVERFARELTALAQAAPLGEYVGPVLLEGEASAEFFNQLLGANVSNPRSIWVENDSDKKQFRPGAFAGRLGLRVAAPFLRIVDDPTMKEFEGTPLSGHYEVDEEGVPAQSVVLVEKGRLKDLLMSRSPAKERARSNGHGRGGIGDLPNAMSGNLVVSSEETVPREELRQRLIGLAREAGLEYGVLIRQLRWENQKDSDDLLAFPLLASKVYVSDGREEPARNVEFSGVNLRALRDIVAVSQERTVYNFYGCGYLGRGSCQVPSSVVAPAILVEEMEFKKTEKKPERLPYLKHPYFD